jgi:hypothetical protein
VVVRVGCLVLLLGLVKSDVRVRYYRAVVADRDRGGLLRSCMLLVVVRIKFIEAIGI